MGDKGNSTSEQTTERRRETLQVSTSDGLRLAVQRYGEPTGPTIVCVHGYPDNHTVWDGVADRLGERFDVVTYDVRGAGDSDTPADRSGYHLDQLADDLRAVLDAVSPDRPVHLLAHDWGSIQTWHAVTDPTLRSRIASYTSISGPCLDHAGQWLRSRVRPNPTALRELATQLVFSGYIGFFHLAPLPELAWRSGVGGWVLDRLERIGAPAAELEPAPKRSTADLVNGLNLYRANMIPRLTRPTTRTTSVPVQVLTPSADPFVSPAVQSDIARWVPDLRVRKLTGGHWLPKTRPELVADRTAEFVDHLEGGQETRSLRRSRVALNQKPALGKFADQLVVITGAGSGIGRATALQFAEQGAEVVVADINEAAAQRTADLARLLGPGAAAYRLDVSDRSAFEQFAKQVAAEHGVPDIVLNNAGIGMAGPFLETDVADWERVIDVNLWGVIHGSRLFAQQMVERGEGGKLVNIASAAAYLTSRALPAYATTKSAVLTLTESLRAELAGYGIGVVAICPGLVNTSITSTTRFVGASATDEAKRQRASTALYRRRNYTPDRAATEIIRAVEKNTALAPITAEARAALVLSRLTPGLLRAAARFDVTPN